MRYAIALFSIAILIASCGGTVQPPPTTPTPETAVTPFNPTEPGIWRMISKSTVSPGEDFTVTLRVILTPAVEYYIFDDTLPKEMAATSTDATVTGDMHFKEAIISELKNRDFVIQAKAPMTPGTYTFSGLYYFNSDTKGDIGGDSTITVG